MGERERIEAVREAATWYLGSPPQRIRPAQGGRSSWELDLADGTAVLFKGGRGRQAEMEGWACRRAAAAGIPVPQVVAIDAAGERFPGGCLIVTRLPGVPLQRLRLPPEARRAVLGEAGALLRRLHQVSGEGYGPPHRSDLSTTGRVRGVASTWSGAVLGWVEASLRHLNGVIHAAMPVEVKAALHRHADLLLRSPGSHLLHGDFLPRHVLVDPQAAAVTGIVDLEGLLFGDPVYDLAVFTFLRDDDLPDLLAGYGPDPALGEGLFGRLALYRLVRAVAEVSWARTAGADGRGLRQRTSHVRRTLDALARVGP